MIPYPFLLSPVQGLGQVRQGQELNGVNAAENCFTGNLCDCIGRYRYVAAALDVIDDQVADGIHLRLYKLADYAPQGSDPGLQAPAAIFLDCLPPTVSQPGRRLQLYPLPPAASP